MAYEDRRIEDLKESNSRSAGAAGAPPGRDALATDGPPAGTRGRGPTWTTPREEQDDRSGLNTTAAGAAAALGGLAGGALGAAAGPIGILAGAAVGAALGGFVGKGIARTIDPADDDAYFRRHFSGRPYVRPGLAYEDYRPAYIFGRNRYDAYSHKYRSFDEADAELARDWEEFQAGNAGLPWDAARGAAKDAWERQDRVATRP